MADRLEHTEQVRRQMLSDLAHEMGTPLSVLTVYLDGLQDGVVDRQRFGQVMSNLLSNALRHTPAGGQVRISVHRQGASTALIHVADDGEGIPPGQLGHIFERFYRGDAARSRDNGGSGIGLTISKALIEAHGGTLTATSPGPGRGAVFALRLPLSPPDSEEAAR